MDRDREGQLYLEARRHQAAQDLLQNRTSFLSTITPPSTNPSSVASSLFREPISSHNQPSRSPPFDSSSFSFMPTIPPTSALSSFSQQRDQATSTTSSFAPVQNIPPKKTRHRSGSSTKGRPKGLEAPMPLKPISPSSLEYQLTANLLKSLDNKSRARSHSRSHPTKRRGTTSCQNHPQHHIITSGHSTGQKTNDEEDEFKANSSSHHCTLAELTPTSLSSIPSSPVSTSSPVENTISDAMSEATREPKLVSVPLPPIPPSPPLPPLPPKSPRSLIAHYFPRSLPPPPPRDRAPYGHKEPLVAPTPFKTPTFGPSMTDTIEAPPLPSPSASFHYIPSTNHSRATHIHVQVDDLSSSFDSSKRSPSTSALGFSVSSRPSQQQQHQDILLFPMRPRSPGFPPSTPNCISSSSRPSTPPLPLAPNSPMYPKGLLPHPHSPLISDRDCFQKPVPFASELVTKASPPSSTNTSRDLEMVLEGITRGQLRMSNNNNRTSMDPWLYTHSPWDDKPLPPVRCEPGERYWVFRDRDGLVPGPILFVVGHVCPVLWWVGSVYPRTRHPGETPVVVKRQASKARLWITDRWELVKIKGIILIKPFVARGTQKTFSASLESVEYIHEGVSVVGGATTVGSGPALQVVPIPGSSEEEEETTRGPWSAMSDRASSLFEQRMEYDRKVLRYELDLRWRRMNLAWSVGSFVLAIAITAIVLASV